MKLRKKISLTCFLATIIALYSCAVLKSGSATPEHEIDLVCEMKVDKAEAYSYKYEGKKYYFDTYNCKEAFKMNPKKFIENRCVTK